MKIKELLKTVNVAWSPPAQHPIMLAAGTAAQQLDASFNTSASLDLYSLNLQQLGYEMELQATISSDHRFHKIIWGSYGNSPAGIIVGGCDYGTIKIYSASKLLAKEGNCLISSPDRHTGPVRAMDFNPFQANLLATGATESEIYIWDLINTNTPMTPGSRSQPLEDVQHIAWNKQVPHILASTFSQCCVIWDLKKNEPIIKLTDANSRVRWKVVQWHPDVATQLCLASEDDQIPIIELWDLRFAMSPLKTLQGHQRGVLSIAWNPHDPDLLLSCAKDNRILCWNPNSDAPNGELVCELAQTKQWNFDVSWCPRYPGLIVGSSFDGHAVVYSLLGGQQVPVETSNKIVDSFPGMSPFTQPPPTVQTEATAILTKAPKWLKRPFGASFGFGGKLVIFENQSTDPNLSANSNRRIIISQVITQPDLIQRSNNLEETLKTEQYDDYCKDKMDRSMDEHIKKIWSCVRAYFSENVTGNILKLLDYNVEALNNKLNQFIPQDDMSNVVQGVSNLNVLNGNIMDGCAAFDAIAQEQSKKAASNKTADSNYIINTTDDEDGLITQAILLGNIEAAVSLCFSTKRYADAVILSMAAGPDLLARTQYRYFSEHSGALNSLINSLVSENWVEVVKNSNIKCWKEALVGIFTHSNAQKERSALCDMLGDRLASCENSTLRKEAQICYICSGNLNKLIEVSDADIQEIVELVVIMQKALELQGIHEVQIEDKVAAVLSQYAEMLAAEGNLEAALNYLGNSQEQRITMLKDRLCRALGYIEDQRHIMKPVTQNYYEQTWKMSQGSQNTYNPPQLLQQATPVQNWNTTPLKQTYGAPANQSSQPYGMPPPPPPPSLSQPQMQPAMYDQYSTSHMYNQTPTVQPPPLPPPPTSSSSLSGSRPPSVGPQSRSKYLIDPSVKSSTPSYGQSGFSQNQYNSQQISSVPNYSPQNSYQPQASMSGNPPSAYSSNQPPSFTSNPKEPEPYKPFQPANMIPPMQNTPQTQMYDPIRSQPLPQMPTYGNEMYQLSSQPSGWNDPPIGKTSRMPPKTEFQPQNPILHPLQSGQPEPSPLHQDNFYQEPHVPYNPQYGQNVLNTGSFNKSVESSQPAVPATIVEPEKPKAPIPEQHMHLKTILDELKNQCYENAKHPQVKRKIEDVSKKLEVLYDCLRENKLSQNTLQALHQISQMIQNGNYTGGMDLHKQLVSGPDFSQIASFMPGIKVLLQSALQLSVYIR